MRRFTVRELQKKPRECVDAAQDETVVITRYGKPVALVLGMAGHDHESVGVQLDSGLWRLVETRRQAEGIPLKTLRSRLPDVEGALRPRRTPGRS